MANMVSSALVELPTKPHALYRFYDRTDVLLYVGITVNLTRRIGDHRRDKDWWLEVAYVKVQHFPNRDEALNAEAEAIRAERPLYNDLHNEKVADDPLEAEWLRGRHELAIDLLGLLLGARSVDERLARARAVAQEDLQLPECERIYAGEVDEDVITAIALAGATVTDVWRFRHVVENLLRELPPGLVAHCEGAAAIDWHSAGESDAHRLDRLPDILCHLGYALREHFLALAGEERVADVP